ncbi:hypothetical protein [Ensifer adhaerens]|uniref:hypothetical protein n=1 Tax=Ensifer adhaerens TaxID=106592 RepID=UPI001C4DF730|nr:hypothetical protein [Ensifer adhaerens]MBW0365988.1 hypothetical protein [Ensifer adhaerens]UCM20110.1 hypothetical protein LDL63_00460 [Ensifer adhaerens]
MPHRCPLAVLAALGLVAVTATANMALAETKATPAATGSAHPTAATIGAFMPAGYREAGRRTAVVDGEAAELVRYERADGRNAALGGEHFSIVIADDGRLKGFARIDLDLVRHPLPTREEAQAIAMDFLRKAAPDLLPGMRISWIDPHDEPLRVARKGRAEDLTLTGMKVKMRNQADGLWMWVIVGADRKVMVFERDIHWISFPGRRGTEKWLHDAWLVEKGYSLGQS